MMRGFSYDIRPGLKEFPAGETRLFVIARRVPPTSPQHFATQVMASAIEQDTAWISLLFNPAKVAERRLWHGIHDLRPAAVAERFAEQTALPRHPESQKRTLTLLTQFSLMAASGVLQQPQHDPAIERMVQAIPDFEAAVPQSRHMHAATEGILQAHLRRVTAS
jgi:hypothetical protein